MKRLQTCLAVASLVEMFIGLDLAYGHDLEINESGEYCLVGNTNEATGRSLSNVKIVSACPTSTTINVSAQNVRLRLFDSVVDSRVCVSPGARATVELAQPTDLCVSEGGELTVARNSAVWCPNYDPFWSGENGDGKVALWLDASKTDTMEFVESLNPSDTVDVGCERIHIWNDWRFSTVSTHLHAVNTRGTDYSQVFPILKDDEQTGNKYVSMRKDGSSPRRIFFDDMEGDGSGTLKGFPSRFVIMVFGAQNGGGYAMVAADDAAFLRDDNSLSTPMMKTYHRTWLNGREVDPTKTAFSNGWQVVAFETDGAKLWGLGYTDKFGSRDSAPSLTGGQNYGDIIVFSTMPSAEEVAKIERYLAHKWGLESYCDFGDDLISAKAYGRGTLKVETAMRLGGAFSGSLTSNGQVIRVEGEKAPDSSVVLDSGRLGWWDPSYPEAISNSSSYVNAVYDRGSFKIAGSWLLGSAADVSTRRPQYQVEARGFGPELPWIDMVTPTSGTMLRIYPYPLANGKNTTINPKTLFIVQDSSCGGGTPILDTVSGSRLSPRLAVGMAADSDVPVWGSSTSASASVFASGETRLNGVQIDGTRQGFYGRPEVLTAVSSSGNFPFGIVGYYNNNNATGRGEIIGEVIAYENDLSDQAKLKIEAYLMWKWFRELPTGYADHGHAVLSGTGNLRIRSASIMPRLNDYNGDVTIEEGRLAFSFSTHASPPVVVDTIVCGSISLPEDGEISLSADGCVRPGQYRLISASGLTKKLESWKVSGDKNFAKRKLRLKVDDAGLLLDVRGPGLILMFR